GLLLRYSLNMTDAAAWVEAAVQRVLEQGRRTGDIAKPGEKVLGTREMSDHVVHELEGGWLRESPSRWSAPRARPDRRHSIASRSASSRGGSCAPAPPSAPSARLAASAAVPSG